jgi:hypothetical protein
MMDEYTRDLQLTQTICASDAFSDALSNARVVLEEAEEVLSAEHYQGIRRFVFPLLEAEWERLDEEYRSLRGRA